MSEVFVEAVDHSIEVGIQFEQQATPARCGVQLAERRFDWIDLRVDRKMFIGLERGVVANAIGSKNQHQIVLVCIPPDRQVVRIAETLQTREFVTLEVVCAGPQRRTTSAQELDI